MDIYDRINKLLKEQKKTRKTLAEISGVSYNTLTSLFMRRSKNIEIETLKKLARGLNTTVDYLVTGNDVPQYTDFVIPEKYKDIYLAFHNGVQKLTQEDINDILQFIEFKNKHRE